MKQNKEQIRNLWAQVLFIPESNIGFKDSFFSLGGNSLLAVKLINLINGQFNTHLSVIDFLTSSTIEDLFQLVSRGEANLIEQPTNKSEDRAEQVTLSELLILRDNFSTQHKNIYNESIVVEINQPIDFSQFEQAVEKMLTSCEVLRANYHHHEGNFRRIIRAKNNAVINFLDLSSMDAWEDKFKNNLSILLQKEFNLEKDNLIQFHLFKVGDIQYRVVLIYFHAILDGTSIINILLPKFMEQLLGNNAIISEEKISSICQLSAYLDEYYNTNKSNKLAYWKNFMDKQEPCNLSPNVTGDTLDHRGFQYAFNLGNDLKKQLSHLAALYDISLFDVLLSGFYLVVSKFSHQNSVTVRTNIDERLFNSDYQNVLGCFTNNLLVGINLQANWTINELFNAVKENKIQAIKHAVSYHTLLDVDRDRVSAFSGIHFNVAPQETAQHIYQQSQIYANSHQVKNDLYIELDIKSENILGRVEFKTSLFDQEYIHGLVDAYQIILSQLSSYQSKPIFSIPVISSEQKIKLKKMGTGDLGTEYKQKNLVKYFDQQVKKYLENIAITSVDINITYRALDELSNQIAHTLKQEYAIEKGDLVAVCADRNYLTLSSIWAILKLGAAYVPIDPSYPEKRIEYILDDTKAKLLISESTYDDKFFNLNVETNYLFIDDKDELNAIKNQPISSFKTDALDGNTLAYIIYTSGSTGNPKGVMIQHKNVVNYINWLKKYTGMSEKSVVDFSSSLSFDLTVSTSIAPLCVGARVVCCDNAVKKDPTQYHQYLVDNKVTIVKLTPSYVSALLPIILNSNQLSNLHNIIIGGEAARAHDISTWLKQYPDHRFHNEYGPTETTVAVSQYEITKDKVKNLNTYVPIGQPGFNSEIYILDNHQEVLPEGMVGELYIGGAGVSQGYLNLEETTKERFIFKSDISSNCLYKTGDLARWNSQGELVYLGRKDSQVKIRGFRIELGEIENVLLNYSGIQQVAVMATNRADVMNEDKYLVAYYVSDEILDEEKIINYLQDQLPEFMVPQVLRRLSVLPLTTNGKLDTKALPDVSAMLNSEIVPGRNTLDQQVLTMWGSLLGIEITKISILDNFFRLGGDSIIAIQFVSQMRKHLGLQVSVKDIFKYPTIKRLVDYVLSHNTTSIRADSEIAVLSETEYLQHLNADSRIEGAYLANNLQQGFIYHALSQKDDDSYRVQMLWEYHNSLDVIKYHQAWQQVQQAYPSLRLRFSWEHDLVQIIDKTSELFFKIIDVSHEENISKRQALVDEYVTQDRQLAYDLMEGKLLRIYLFKLTEEHYQLLLSNHHAILDGWSMPILMDRFHSVYLSLLRDDELSVHPDETYALAQKYLQTYSNEHQTFWANYVSSVKTSVDLSGLVLTEKRHIALNEYKYVEDPQTLRLTIHPKNYANLKDFSQSCGITMSTIAQLALHRVMSIYSNSSQTVVGTVVSGRSLPIEDIDQSVGLYINTLPLIVSHDVNQSIQDALFKMQEDINEMNHRSNVNLSKLQGAPHRLFDILFVYENYPVSSIKHAEAGLHVNFITSIEKVDYPLTLVISENYNNSSLELELYYAGELFSQDRIQEFFKLIRHFFEEIPSLFNSTVSALGIKQDNLIGEKDSTVVMPNLRGSLPKIFEMQSIKYAERIALYSENREITYGELNAKSNQIAHYLRDVCQIQSEDLIGLCFDRTEQSLVALLGILKAGAAYVPMDPHTPDERLAYIISDTKMKQVLTQSAHQSRLENVLTSTQVLALDHPEMQKILCKQSSENLLLDIPFDQLAYIIYTSGTTGKPKGVMQTHQNVVRLFSATEHWYGFTEKDVWTLFHSIVFDFSVWEIWGALLHGGKLVIPTYDETRDLNLFYALCLKTGVTVLNQTPSAFYQFMEVVLQEENTRVHEDSSTESTNKFSAEVEFRKKSNLRYVIFGGEALNISQLRPWFERYGFRQPHLINMYGITETTVHVTYKLLTESDLNEGVSSIGEVIPDQYAYVLDSHLNPLPIGAIGELYVGGAGLARGYWNRPELTAERFISNPYQTVEEKALDVNARLYKTGDLVSWQSERNLEYRGRNDSQVKIRGYRIELGEIESVLSQHEQVRQAVVLAKEHPAGGSYLVAYYVADQAISADVLKTRLEALLPDYMVPNIYLHLATFPLTINGKLDRSALPEPSFVQPTIVVSPRTELEQQVSAIWAELLGVALDVFSIQDDFFRLGGDSIVSIQLVSRLRQRLGLSINVKDIFAHKTVERLYDAVISKLITAKEITTKTESGILLGPVNLLPIQEWFFENDVVDAHHWNQAFMITVPLLDKNKLENCLKKLVEHHDALRLRYVKKGNKIQQSYVKDIQVPEISSQDISFISESALQGILTEWQSNFDLQHGPLFHVGYLTGYADGSARLHFAFHHLIMDSVSWRIIIEDLRCLYEGGVLAPKSSSYRQWSEAVQAYAENHETEKKYWNDISFRHCEKLSSGPGASSHFTLNITQTENLLSGINHVYQTQINDVLLSALSLALFQLTGECDHSILLEGHGREEINDTLDITRTVGWFTTMYPVQLMSKSNALEILKNTKEMLRKIPNKGIGYGSFHGYHAEILPKISFNYLGQFEQRADALWALTNEKIGQVSSSKYHSPLLININGWVVNGELQFSLDGQLVQESLDKLAEYYQQSLEKLIKILKKASRCYLTTSDVDNVINQEYLDEIQANREVEAVYLANNLQQGFIYHALTQGNIDQAYRVQISWEYHNKLDVDKLQHAWKLIQNIFPTLRLRFAWTEQMVQIIDKEAKLNWQMIDLSKVSIADQKEQCNAIRLADEKQPYDLSESGLFRLYLIKHHESYYTCIFNNHHSILDGWSVQILLEKLHQVYTELTQGLNKAISPELIYGDAQKYLQTHLESKEYWQKYIQTITDRPQLEILLKSDCKRIKIGEYKHIQQPKKQRMLLNKELFMAMKNLGQEYAVTPNAFVQYAWHKMLSVFGNSQQTIGGTVVSGRNIPVNDIEQSVGMYINTLPIIMNHGEHESLIAAIKNIQQDINEANSRSNVNLSELQDKGERLFNNLFVYENFPETEKGGSDLNIQFLPTVTKFDYPLGLVCEESKEGLWLELRFAGELFDDEAIKQLLSFMTLIVEQVVHNPQASERSLSLVNEAEYKNLYKNQHEETLNLSKMFSNQVSKTPENIALVYKEKRYTYKALNQTVIQFARYLQSEYKIKQRDVVAVCLERSDRLVIAMLAIMKLGATYLPLDFDYPEERKKYILTEANAALLLTPDNTKIQENIIKYSCDDFEVEIQPSDLAYIVYTSGTTGKPKGVMIRHKSIVSRLSYLKREHHISEDMIFGAKIPAVFDPAIRELFLPLISGAKVVMFSDEENKDVAKIAHLCMKEQINFLIFVPSHLELFVEYVEEMDANEQEKFKLSLLYSCGEVLTPLLAKKVLNLFPEVILKNQYGPSEACQFSFEYSLTVDDILSDEKIPVGSLVDNMQAYVLDENQRLLPKGAVGELYLAGTGLAHGYINQLALTNINFISNPFQEGERLYKTGDLVRWRESNVLEYVGRNDFQVKLRGFRIELNEIESQLLAMEKIKQAVVICKDQVLIAYYVAEHVFEQDVLSHRLSKILPEYMIPSAFVHLDALPLTNNGKLDRKNLPEHQIRPADIFLPPTTDLEKIICGIYQDVLDLKEKPVSLLDDFFYLGGNSISSIRLVNRLRKEVDQEMEISSIFKYRKIKDLIHHLNYSLTAKKILQGVEIEF